MVSGTRSTMRPAREDRGEQAIVGLADIDATVPHPN
jgi:hypothetical protein